MKKVRITIATAAGLAFGATLAALGVWAILFGTPGQLHTFWRFGIVVSIACFIINILMALRLRRSRVLMEEERLRYEESRGQYEESTAAMRRAQQAYENISCSPERPPGPIRATGVRVYPQLSDADLRILFPGTPPAHVIEPIHPAIEWGDSWPSVPGAGNARPE